MRIPTIILILWLACTLSYAHSEENSVYKVEMILFSHQDSEGTGAQRRQDGIPGPDLENPGELSWDPALSDYVILSEFDKELGPVVDRLNRSPRYQVIMHLIWRQSMPTRETAKPLHIHGGTDFSGQFLVKGDGVNVPRTNDESNQLQMPLSLEQVDGTVTFFVGRYLHILTDLVYRQPTVLKAENTENSQVRESNVLLDYTVRNNRKMRSEELHYIDHPLLGILVKITPIENNSQP